MENGFDRSITDRASNVIEEAVARDITLGCAESCTGGLVAGALTAIAGSSDAFLGGIVSYSNEAKMSILGVPEATLASVGAVSAQTAEAMCEGAARALSADITVSTTGIAGPGGGSDEKPVGTVWFGVHSAQGTRSILHTFEDRGRSAIREDAVRVALDLLAREIENIDSADNVRDA